MRVVRSISGTCTLQEARLVPLALFRRGVLIQRRPSSRLECHRVLIVGKMAVDRGLRPEVEPQYEWTCREGWRSWLNLRVMENHRDQLGQGRADCLQLRRTLEYSLFVTWDWFGWASTLRT